MKSITVEDDVYEFLLKNAREIGESASDILRRLLRLQGKQGGKGEFPKRAPEANLPIEECLSSTKFRFKNNAIDRLLVILSWLYQRDPENFKKVLQLKGTKRVYFSDNKKELTQSGTSVNPKPIPESSYWVISNTSTEGKKGQLREVMSLLGYDMPSIKRAIQSL